MSELKSNLEGVLGNLKALEERARGLKNQNLADVATSARAKVQQLSEHPDLKHLEEKPAGEFDPKAPTTKEEAVSRMQADGLPDPEGRARASWPYLFEPSPFKADPNAPQPVQQPDPLGQARTWPSDPNAPQPAAQAPNPNGPPPM